MIPNFTIALLRSLAWTDSDRTVCYIEALADVNARRRN